VIRSRVTYRAYGYILVIVKLPDPLQPDIMPVIVQVPETVFMLLIEP